MKAGIGLFLISLLFAPATAQIRTDKDIEGFIGQVRGVRMEQAPLTNKKGKSEEGPRTTDIVVRYDSAGRMTEEVHYASGCLARKLVYTYDAEGNGNQDFYGAEALIQQNIIGNRGNRLETKPTRMKIVFRYDAQGNRAENDYYYADGRLFNKIILTYGTAGRLTEKTTYGANGSILGRFVFNHDADGRMVEDIITDYRASQPWKGDHTYEFDSVGNWIKRITTASIIKDGKAVEQYKKAFYHTIRYVSAQPGVENSSGSSVQDDLAPAPCELAVMTGSGRLSKGNVRKKAEPKYPLPAKQAKISGPVVVEAVVDEAGNVISASALTGPELLRDAAVEAAKKWSFEPAFRDGVPVKIVGTIRFDFQL